MPDQINKLQKIRRPKLLIRAARHGSVEYNRNRDLGRLLRSEHLPVPSRALHRLMDIEADLENTRKGGDNAYSISRHVEILIALMGEARLLSTAQSCG